MNIAHMALYVGDLERSKAFFQRYFHADCGEKYHNPKTGLSTYFLTFGTGAALEIMHRPERTPDAHRNTRQGFIHLAFSLGSKEAVDSLTATLENDGYMILSHPRTTGDGYYESCILDEEGNEIELVA